MTADEFLDTEPDLQPVRQMAYGPVVDEWHHDAMVGPKGNRLGKTDVAVSPDTGLKQGDLVMAQDGSLHTAADWSYLHPNQPTHKTVEFRDRKDQGYGFIQKVNSIDDFLGKPPNAEVRGVTPPVTANLPPEEVTLQGVLQKNLKAGAQAGVYPKAQRATAEDRWAQSRAEEPAPSKSFQEKALDFLDGKGSLSEAVAPIGKAIGRTVMDLATLNTGQPMPLVGDMIPREEREATSPGQVVTKAAYNTVADLVNFANTPEGEATLMATGGLPKVAQQLVALGFGAQGVKNAIDSAMQGDFAGALEGLGIGALAGKGARDIGKVSEPKAAAPLEGFEVSRFEVDPKVTVQLARSIQIQRNLPEVAPVTPPVNIKPSLPLTPDEYALEIQAESDAGIGGGQGQQPTSVEAFLGVAPTQTAGARGTTGETVGISQARTEAELGTGSVEPGTGADMGSGLAFGRDFINKGGDPRLPIRRAVATGLVGKNEVGVVHAELERLRMDRNLKATVAEAQPDNVEAQLALDVADKAQRAWRKELQPVLTKASDALREAYAQSRSEPDVGSWRGLADLIDEHFKGNTEMTPEDRTQLQKVAKGVRNVRSAAKDSVAKVVKETKRIGRRIMTPDQLHADLQSLLKDAFKDCAL